MNVTDPSVALECPLGSAALLYAMAKSEPNSDVALRMLFLAKLFVLHKYSELGDDGISESRWPVSVYQLMDGIKSIRGLGAAHIAFPVYNNVTTTATIVSYCNYPAADNGLTRWSRENKQRYADTHGYRLIHVEEPLDRAHHAWMNKVLAIQYALTAPTDWVMWMDCDAFVMNQTITVAQLVGTVSAPTVDLVLSEDANMLNSAIMIFRNSQWSKTLVNKMADLLAAPSPFSFRDNLYHEQSVLMYLTQVPPLLTNPRKVYVEEVQIVPQKWINAYPAEIAYRSSYMHHAGFIPGDWIVSFNGCGSVLNGSACDVLMHAYFIESSRRVKSTHIANSPPTY